MRRAQFEILGLAIIMIIISVAIFFLLAVSKPSDENPESDFQTEQFSQNVLDAILKTSVAECPQYKVFDAIAWQLGPSTPPTVNGQKCKDDENSDLTTRFQWINDEIIKRIFSEYSGKHYHLQIRKTVCSDITGRGCEKATYSTGGCTPSQVGKPGRQIISLYPQDPAEIVLWTCDE